MSKPSSKPDLLLETLNYSRGSPSSLSVTNQGKGDETRRTLPSTENETNQAFGDDDNIKGSEEVASPSLPDFVCQWELKGHTKAISSVKFSPNGEYLATASGDQTVRIWRLSDAKCISTLFGLHRLGINDIVWSPDSQYICTASDDSYIGVWDVSSAQPIRLLRGHTNHVVAIDYSPKGTLIASGSMDECLILWDASSGACIRRCDAHSEGVLCVQFSRDGSLIVTAALDGLCRFWDSYSGHCLKTVHRQNIHSPVTSVSFSLNGMYLLASYGDGVTILWDYMSHEKRGIARKVYCGHKSGKYTMPSRFLYIEQTNTTTNNNSDHTNANHDNNKPGDDTRMGEDEKDTYNPSSITHNSHNPNSESTSTGVDGGAIVDTSDWPVPYALVGSECGSVCVYDINSCDMVMRVLAHKDPVIAMDVKGISKRTIKKLLGSNKKKEYLDKVRRIEKEKGKGIEIGNLNAIQEEKNDRSLKKIKTSSPSHQSMFATGGMHHDPVVRVWVGVTRSSDTGIDGDEEYVDDQINRMKKKMEGGTEDDDGEGGDGGDGAADGEGGGEKEGEGEGEGEGEEEESEGEEDGKDGETDGSEEDHDDESGTSRNQNQGDAMGDDDER